MKIRLSLVPRLCSSPQFSTVLSGSQSDVVAHVYKVNTLYYEAKGF